MSLPETIQRIYHELAIRYDRQNEVRLRDDFYLLAADVAFASGRYDEAERLHCALLEVNPNSVLKPFPTFADAAASLDIQHYLADLRRQYPPGEAERLLLLVRANPLGGRPEGVRFPSQRDTQEVIPPTARTVHVPGPKRKSAPRLPGPDEPSTIGPSTSRRRRFAWLLAALMAAVAGGLAYVFLVNPASWRPVW